MSRNLDSLVRLVCLTLSLCAACRAPSQSQGATDNPASAHLANATPSPTPASVPQQAARQAPAGLRVLTTALGTFDVHWQSEPQAIERGLPFVLRVWITPHGRMDLVPWAGLSIDADMPEHLHGMNRVPRITRHADGSFLVEGMVFHMPGRWDLYFDVHEAAIVERGQVALDLE